MRLNGAAGAFAREAARNPVTSVLQRRATRALGAVVAMLLAPAPAPVLADGAGATARMRPDSEKPAKPAARKNRFVDQRDGIVRDRKSGLQWSQSDDGNEYNFPYAVAFCENLDLSGRGWRLPTRKEWTELVEAAGPQPIECGDRVCRLPPEFKLLFSWVWTSERDGDVNAWKFDLGDGTPFSETADVTVHGRAICVRKATDAARAAKAGAK